jgi:hypothetical protein
LKNLPTTRVLNRIVPLAPQSRDPLRPDISLKRESWISGSSISATG